MGKIDLTEILLKFRDYSNINNLQKLVIERDLDKIREIASHLNKDIVNTVPVRCNFRGLVFQETAVYMACVNGDLEIVKILVEGGADVDETAVFKDGSNTSPLWVAARNNHLDLCKYLLSRGARVNNGYSALMGAVDKGREEIVKLLLDAGANPTKVGDDGETPLDRARHKQFYTIVELLEQYEAAPVKKVHEALKIDDDEDDYDDVVDTAEERTLLVLKHDGVQRGLVGTVIRRFEQKGLKLIGIKMVTPREDNLRSFYGDQAEVVDQVSRGPLVAMVWEGERAVSIGKVILGDNQPGSVVGDYGDIVHSSDSVGAANKDIDIWFNKQEISGWSSKITDWVNGQN